MYTLQMRELTLPCRILLSHSVHEHLHPLYHAVPSCLCIGWQSCLGAELFEQLIVRSRLLLSCLPYLLHSTVMILVLFCWPDHLWYLSCSAGLITFHTAVLPEPLSAESMPLLCSRLLVGAIKQAVGSLHHACVEALLLAGGKQETAGQARWIEQLPASPC